MKKHKRAKPDPRAKVARAALDLAAQTPWEDIKLAQIAARAGLSLVALHAAFEDKSDILGAALRLVDARVMERLESLGDQTGLSTRERLFDVLMERFETLQEERAAMTSILAACLQQPQQALMGLPHLCRSLGWMAQAAGLDVTGWEGALRLAGLTALYLHVLKTWMDDDGPDLAKTMAALDKDLARAERAILWIESMKNNHD